MAFYIPDFARPLIEHWWHAICEAVDGLLERIAPGEDGSAPRLLRVEVQAMSSALAVFEAMVRRMLVVLAAQHGPAEAPPDLPKLLFRIDECPPEPVIRRLREPEPDYLLNPPPARALPARNLPTDGLVSAASILRRVQALLHVFENGEAYMQAMRARFCAALPPLPLPLPEAFGSPSITPELRENLYNFHELALDAQACNTS